MNDNAKKWVEALRSGEYQQARCLRSSDGSLCCLGVANEISGIGDWGTEDGKMEERYFAIGEEALWDEGWYGGEEEFAHDKVAEWLGLADKEGTLSLDENTITTLARLNDDGKSFLEIADIIEAHADQLFSK